MIRRKHYILGFKVNKTCWTTFHTAKYYFSTMLSVILRLFIKNGSHGWKTGGIWIVEFKWLEGVEFHSIKDALASLRKFVEGESPLKMVRNAFHLKYFSRSHDV